MRTTIAHWTVDYRDGGDPKPVVVPHAWQQDVPVAFEGPAVYRTRVTVPRSGGKLVFNGVNYEASVSIDQAQVLTHMGPWDAFVADLTPFAGKEIEVAVSVTKAGGSRFPSVTTTAGFLPSLFQTFGGIFKTVQVVSDECVDLEPPAPPSRVKVRGTKIEIDGKPFYVRGLLHLGWYPELGHQNPPEETIRDEIRAAKRLGFNLVKFCLWLPPHAYLEFLKQEGMEAWLEVPVGQLSETGAPPKVELSRIVRQYARHDNIVIWTCGSELGADPLTRYVQGVTGCPLVRSSGSPIETVLSESGSSGTFHNLSLRCEPHFHGPLFESLEPGARTPKPTLSGVLSDAHVHRDLARLGDELPYWASTLPELNAEGTRLKHELPNVIQSHPYSNEPTASGHREQMESSRQQALFMRKSAAEQARSKAWISGYVVDGWRDTPISSSGMFDDWGDSRFSPEECALWNGPNCLFLIPSQKPLWVRGGHRPGRGDPLNRFAGDLAWKVGCHSTHGLTAGVSWEIQAEAGQQILCGGCLAECDPLESREIADIIWKAAHPGSYVLIVRFGDAINRWPVWVVDSANSLEGIGSDDSNHYARSEDLAGLAPSDLVSSELIFVQGEVTIPRPFWRQATYEFRDKDFWKQVPFKNRWERLVAVCTDRTIDPAWLSDTFSEKAEVLLNRIDTCTYEELPVLVRIGGRLITTLNPFGGAGAQPTGLQNNPAGCELLRSLIKALT